MSSNVVELSTLRHPTAAWANSNRCSSPPWPAAAARRVAAFRRPQGARWPRRCTMLDAVLLQPIAHRFGGNACWLQGPAAAESDGERLPAAAAAGCGCPWPIAGRRSEAAVLRAC